MSDASPPTSVGPDELLARFITSSRWIRTSDHTVKQDAFIPHPYPDLSVTRHKDLSAQELWKIGQDIASQRPATLYGRADVTVEQVLQQKLCVEAQPVLGNLNHASITGWPADKPAQKMFAQELAANAQYVAKPTSST